jgi:hypothetical protein
MPVATQAKWLKLSAASAIKIRVVFKQDADSRLSRQVKEVFRKTNSY